MVSARTTRAKRVQSTTTMAAITEVSPAPITATSTSTVTSAPPTQSRDPPRLRPAIHRDGGRAALSRARSTMAQPRIEQRHQEVDGEIERDEQHGEGQDQALDQREIAIDHRVD